MGKVVIITIHNSHFNLKSTRAGNWPRLCRPELKASDTKINPNFINSIAALQQASMTHTIQQ